MYQTLMICDYCFQLICYMVPYWRSTWLVISQNCANQYLHFQYVVTCTLLVVGDAAISTFRMLGNRHALMDLPIVAHAHLLE